MTTSTCAPCGRVFTSLAGFDAHQERRFGEPVPIVCHDPATRGLVLSESTGRWQLPIDADSRERLVKMRASRGVPHTSGTPRDENGSDSRTEASP